MDVLSAIAGRKSTRVFKGDPVPKDLIEQVLQAAIQAPSSSNQQPWRFFVVMGSEKERLTEKLLKACKERLLKYDPGKGKTIPQEYVDKTRELFKDIRTYIQESGKPIKDFVEEGSYQFYHAPVAILVAMEKCFPRSRLVDIGLAAENLMLAAHGLGLGTCALALILACEDVMKEKLKIPDNLEIVLGIALGYPDTASPLYQFKSSRDPLETIVVWKGC
ncbi:MAG TPA: nitroreductase [Thermodesulfobacteriota bacterium]|nr:nitroreductase [Thermodesulfobacteriota bacterium]